MQLRTAQAGDSEQIRRIVGNSGLPVQDFGTAAITFIVAVADGEVVGVVGLERFGDTGLLRSLSVDPAARCLGTGGRLVGAVEEHAGESGTRQLLLLTQTADAFFARRGYGVIARGDAPPRVQESAEFRSLCPASAVCMLKIIAGEPL